MLLEDQILASGLSHPMGEAHRVGHEERPTVGRRMGLPGNQSERSVNPRRSDDHRTAVNSMPVPRRIWPARTLGPVRSPRYALSTLRVIHHWLWRSTTTANRCAIRARSSISFAVKPPGRSVTNVTM